jgi:pSer/pThr/pTyr-binding forkhead associated (FHA) protein
MSLQAKTLLNLIAGAIAGVLAWALTDLTGWFPYLNSQAEITAFNPQFVFYGAIFGLMLGVMLGVVEALSLDSQRQMAAALGFGAGIGFVGGAIGLPFAQTVYSFLSPSGLADSASPLVFFQTLFARAIGYAVVGAIVGASQGASRRSWLITRQGAVGGLMGGALGGMLFQITALLLNTAVLARLVALVATGALVGFFIGLVQNLFKQAWIRVVLGRNEGKEYLLAKPITTIGRSELSDIGLYGDPQIAPTHAVIEAIPAQRRHRLRHVAEASANGRGGPYVATQINGYPITAEQWLTDGDTLQIGKRTLLFQEKATRGIAPVPHAPQRSAPTPAQTVAAPPSSATVMLPKRFVGQELTEVIPPAFSSAAATGATTVMTTGAGGLGSRLVCTLGSYAGQSFPLSHTTLSLGRSSECDIPLTADTLISRRQAEILYQEGRHILHDLGSANGTYVNGARLSADHPLSAGDLIQMGDSTLRYE